MSQIMKKHCRKSPLRASIWLIISATGVLTPALASIYEVRGVMTETETGQGCPAAVYRIYNMTDSVMPVVSNITDTIGQFVQPLDTTGDYRLVTEFIGTKTTERLFTITDEQPVVILDTIPLSADESTLNEVVVTYRKPLIESDGGTLTYNMEEDPMAKSNNVLEMLRKVPMVTVDAEDNIKVKGQSSFKILVNGKEDPMFSTGNISTVLKAMPASTIKKIEVITEPGAKYDAEGAAGILNIVTIGKQNLEGVFGNINAWVGKGGSGASGYIRTKIGKVAASLNASYYASEPFKQTSNSTSEVENLNSETNRLQKTQSKQPSQDYSSTYGNFNLSWEPDTLNLFTISANISNWNSKSGATGQMDMFNSMNESVWHALMDMRNKYNSLSYGGQISYQHTFKKEGHYIVASYQTGNNDGNSKSIQEYTEVENFPVDYRYQLNKSTSKYMRHVGQIDYALPITEKHLIEAGAKFTGMTNQSLDYPMRGMSEETAEKIINEERKTENYQNILAIYASYRGKFGDFTGKVGVRYEHTNMGLKYKIGDNEDFSSTLNDVVPNASLSYNFTPGSNMRLGYQMRISRPSLWQLNPYRSSNSITSVYYGNPDLTSEKSHNLSLSYSNYGGKIGGSAGIGYDYNGNSICDYIFSGTDGLINSTYANIGRQQTTSLNVNVDWSIIDNMNLSLYGYGYYKDIRATSPELTAHTSGWGGNFNINWNYRLPYSIRLSAYGGGGSGWFDIQWKSASWYYYGMSVAKSFLKDDALTLSLGTQNMFNPTRTSSSSSHADGLTTRNRYSYSNWGLSFSVTWQFGSLRSDVKRTAANVSGDDSGSGGGQSKGGK